jgi:heme/copper-type cytochrome/quinol oxidase subunit 2
MTLSVERLNQGMDTILTLLKFHKEREASHRDLVEEMNTRVVMWSIVEAIVLIVLSVFPVYYLRHFFNVKRG